MPIRMSRKLLPASVVAALALLFMAGSAMAGELIVSAAASLKDAFQAIKPEFEKAHPGTTLTYNFAASGVLLRQMEEGAPVDVFASADEATMDKAQAKNLIKAETRKPFAQNELVLVTPVPPRAPVSSVKDLETAAVKGIAIGTPASVPAGNYTKQSLEASGQWAALQPKFIMAESVRQVLDYVARGEVDAGFVYRTDAMVQAGKVHIVTAVPLKAPVTYPVAVMAASKDPKAAASFAEYIASPKGLEVLGKFGFLPAK